MQVHASRRTVRGFTFIELLYVGAIIGILVAVGIPAYGDYIYRSQVAEAVSQLGDARREVSDFYSRWGYLPKDNKQAGLGPPEQFRGRYLRRLEIDNGALYAQVELGSAGSGEPVVRWLSFRPAVNSASPSAPIVWLCGQQVLAKQLAGLSVIGEIRQTAVEERYLPGACRQPTK